MLERIYLFLDELGEVGVLTGDFFRYLVRRPFEGRLLLDEVTASMLNRCRSTKMSCVW
jgi:hypothetical protein